MTPGSRRLLLGLGAGAGAVALATIPTSDPAGQRRDAPERKMLSATAFHISSSSRIPFHEGMPEGAIPFRMIQCNCPSV